MRIVWVYGDFSPICTYRVTLQYVGVTTAAVATSRLLCVCVVELHITVKYKACWVAMLLLRIYVAGNDNTYVK